MPRDKRYLGDGAYADFDPNDFHPLILYTSDGINVSNKIYFEHSTMFALRDLIKEIDWAHATREDDNGEAG